MKAFRSSLLLWDTGKQVALVHLNMGTLYRRSHQLIRASKAYQMAIENGSYFVKIGALSSLIQLSFDKNDMVSSRKFVLMGYWLSKKDLGHRGKDDLFCNIGTYYSFLGKTKRAKYWLNKSLSINLKTKNRRTKQHILVELANLYLLEGDISDTDHLLDSIQNDLTDSNDSLALAKSLCVIAKRFIDTKEFRKSHIVLTRCYNLLRNLPPSHEQILCCSLLKKYYQRTKDPFLADFYNQEMKYIKKKIR